MPIEKSELLDNTLAQLQAIFDEAPVGLCLLDQDLRYLILNPRLAQMDGVSVADHIGKTPHEIVPEVTQLAAPYMHRALTGEPILGVEIEKSSDAASDSRQSLLLSCRPVRDRYNTGDVLGICVALMDVSERRRVENALRKSEEHLRHMIQLSPHTSWVLNTRGEVIEATPQWESVTGQPMTEALGDGWKRMLHRDDLSHTNEAIADAVTLGKPIDIIYRVHTPAGAWQPMHARGAARLGLSGKVMYIYGAVEVVEEPHPPSPEMRDCIAELRAAIEIIPYGIIIADASDGSVFMVNPGAHAILRGAAYPGQKLNEYGAWRIANAHGTLLAAWEYPLAKALIGGECVEPHRFYLEAPNGTRSPVFLSAKPVHSEAGQLVAGLMMIRTTNPTA